MRIHHIQITTAPEQERACHAFYGDVLGLDEIPKPHALKGRGGAWYRIGAIELHLGIEAATGPSKRHICFEVDDLADLRARLEKAGCVIEEAMPIKTIERFFTRDPAGNKVEFTQPW